MHSNYQHGYPAPGGISAMSQQQPYAVTASTLASHRWSTGLCHCCDDPANCLITSFCPCITFGQIAEIVSQGQTSCGVGGFRYGVLLGFTGLACLYSCIYRSRLRGQYRLEEQPFADCLVHFCCELCALCQEYRELRTRGYDMSIGWEANKQRSVQVVTAAPVMGTMMR